MRQRSRPAAAVAAGAVVAVVLIALVLHALAAVLTQTHVGNQALHRMALFQHRQSPWQWTLRDRKDLVAQRVFGPARLEADTQQGLRLTARNGQAYEIGLPLSSPADVQRASVLHVRLRASRPLQLAVLIRSELDAPLCIAALPDPSRRNAWPLQTLTWHRSNGRSCPMPTRAAMLRLRLRQPAGGTVWLQRVALGLPSTASTPDPTHAVHLRGPANTAQLTQLLQRTPAAAWPIVILPPTHSPQQLLEWRDVAWRLAPAAVVLPHGWTAGRHATPLHVSMPVTWLGIALYIAVLIALLAWRPRRPLRPWLDLIATLFGPLWIIIGLHLASPLDLRQALPLAAGLVYALIAALRDPQPRPWRWIGHWHDYPAPLAVLGVAAALLLAFGHAWAPLTPGRVLVYLAWALLQQWLILAFVLRRLEQALSWRIVALIASATVFALLHTPNARLMLLCFGVELYWAWCFTRRRTLMPIAVAHTLGALALQAALTDAWLRSLGISARYFMPT